MNKYKITIIIDVFYLMTLFLFLFHYFLSVCLYFNRRREEIDKKEEKERRKKKKLLIVFLELFGNFQFQSSLTFFSFLSFAFGLLTETCRVPSRACQDGIPTGGRKKY